MSPQFERALARIDATHAEDPDSDLVDGAHQPKELLYARRMSAWLDRLAPEASEPLRLAARCQHIRRWSIARSSYARDVDGYRKWRADEARAHAQTAATILADVGYDAATIERVRALVRKEQLKRDPEAQLLEDVACLVFLEHYFAEFARKHDEDALLRILRKAWNKMSARGQQAALGLSLAPDLRAIVDRALTQA